MCVELVDSDIHVHEKMDARYCVVSVRVTDL